MDQLKNLLADALDATGADLEASGQAIAHLTATRAAELSVLVGLAGYDQAVVAARDEVALAAGLAAVDNADAATARVLSLIQGGLMMLAGGVA